MHFGPKDRRVALWTTIDPCGFAKRDYLNQGQASESIDRIKGTPILFFDENGKVKPAKARREMQGKIDVWKTLKKILEKDRSKKYSFFPEDRKMIPSVTILLPFCFIDLR